MHFSKVATFSLPCPKRHLVPRWPAKCLLGSRSPQTSWCCLPPANCLSFQRHSRLERLSTFIIIDIPAFTRSFPERAFVFNNIRASFVHFFKVARFSLPCPKRHHVPRWPAKCLLGSRSPQIACAPGGPRKSQSIQHSLFAIHYSFPLLFPLLNPES